MTFSSFEISEIRSVFIKRAQDIFTHLIIPKETQQIILDNGSIRFVISVPNYGSVPEWRLIEGDSVRIEENTYQRRQTATEAMTGKGDVGIGVGGFNLAIIKGCLPQLIATFPRCQTDICCIVAKISDAVRAGKGDDDFVVALEGYCFEATII